MESTISQYRFPSMRIHLPTFLRFSYLKRWFTRYERYLMPAALLAGIAFDVTMFQQVDRVTSYALFALHLVVSGATIAFVHYYDAREGLPRALRYPRLFAPLVIQYTFGALLSGFLVFYWFSSSLGASWPFLLIIVFLLVSNDMLKRHYLRLPVQIGVYFFALFSFFALTLPSLFGAINAWVFAASGVLALGVIAAYWYAASRVITRMVNQRELLIGVVVSVYIAMNALYFLNYIPPVPLALRDAGVFYDIVRQPDGAYRVTAEDQSLLDRLRPVGQFHITPERNDAYVFTSVFAPTRLATDIVHHWQHYDEGVGAWKSVSRVRFPIVGGRTEGFRGFSLRQNINPGRWRVRVETPRGQVIGHTTFSVLESESIRVEEETR